MGVQEASSTILLIDCSFQDTNRIQKILIDHPYNLFTANSLDEALHVIQYIFPDIVLINETGLPQPIHDICTRIRKAYTQIGYTLSILYLYPLQMEFRKPKETAQGVDECIPFLPDTKQPPHIDTNSAEWETILQFSHSFLLSVVQSHIQIRKLKASVEESHRNITRTQRIMDRELDETARMQRSFLPTEFLHHPELELAALYQPSVKVGGDYYDVIPIDEDHWGLVVADIAGHGSAAAVVMALTQMVVKEFGKGILHPNDALMVFNQKLNEYLSSDHYVTMFYTVLDIRSMQFLYAHAGHIPLIMYKAASNDIIYLKSEPSFPLHTFEMNAYEECSEVLLPGDRILFFTDGVTDIQNPINEFFSMSRLGQVLLESQPSSVKSLVQRIFEETENFRESKERNDDFTLLALGRNA